ncbi:MAG TPA: hypothetical protein VGM44_18825, partial [Polyangiaceae bacterium]
MFQIRDFCAGAVFCAAFVPACSSAGISTEKPNPADLKCTPAAATQATDGYALQPFCAPADPGSGNIWFAASGEVLALTGYPFPPASDGDPAFVDGWDVRFTHLLTTIDQITLSENPDLMLGSQQQTGPLVAEVDGPWAVDLSHEDASYLAGKGGAGEEAVPIAALNSQNKNGGDAFATDGTRYAFGFDVVSATDQAQNVNLDSDALADYESMAQNGCTVLYVGTATFKGDPKFDGCVTDATKDWPQSVDFRLCFKSPTTYANCQNPDNDPAEPIAGEEHERGIAFVKGSSVIGQVTLHTDHPFWDSVLHDSPAHFDQFAARVVGQPDGSLVTLEDTQGVDYTAYTDAAGNALNWRYCIEPPTDVHAKFTGPMRFDPESVPHAPGSDPSTGLRDYYDFATYDQSTQGH